MVKTVVLYPGLGVGHLVPMVELAKVFLQHGLAVTMALVDTSFMAHNFSATVARVAAANPSVTFHVLPLPPPAPAGSCSEGASTHHVIRMFESLGAMNAPLRDFLRSLHSVHALIIDMFCIDALDVAAELNLPAYFFFASGAGDLAAFLNLPSMQASIQKSIRELGDPIVSFPGVPPFKASDLPIDVFKGSEASRPIVHMFERMAGANGILINSFESLETRAVHALRDGLCIPSRATPPVYCIGPLVSGGGRDKEDECLRWLDAQPDQSVVFLSFGSLGTFAKKQLEEIATGLDKSGQRFLWVVRSPRSDQENLGESLPEPDLVALLPDGFLERTRERGLVVKSWAPQVDVLHHRATGAFVTHCGWNSTLEGITAGQPLLCWPLYAEQKMNKVYIVEEMKLGVEMRGYNEEMVNAEEVEAKVRWVMQSESGRELRQRVAAAKYESAEALKEGGSSHTAFVRFLMDLDISNGIVGV